MKYETAKAFNQDISVNTKVIYTSLRNERIPTVLTGCARVMFGGAIVAQVRGISGEVDINRIERLDINAPGMFVIVKTAEKFNLLYSVGTGFNYYPFTDSKEYRVVKTTSSAWQMGSSGDAVVCIDAMSGAVNIQLLEYRPVSYVQEGCQ